MNILNKKLFFASLLFLACSLMFAVEWGGGLHNYTQFKGNEFSDLKIDQIDDFNLWVKVPFDKEGRNYFVAEGLYEFELDDEDAYNQLDFNLIKFSFNKEITSGDLSLNFGRFIYSDLTGIIYNQKADGVLAGYSNSRFDLSVYAAYTGLLNGNLVSIIPNKNDVFVYDKTKVYDAAAKYLVAGATFSMPNLFANQTLAAQFLGTFGLEEKSYNRMYMTLAGTGPLAGMLFYNLSTTFGLESFDGDGVDATNLTSLNLTYFFSYKSATVSAGVIYASGENGPFKGFNGFTECEAYSAMSKPMYSGLVKLLVAGSIKPVDLLLLNADVNLIFDTEEDASYKGFQYSFAATVQPFSDLLFRAGIKHYIDSDNSDLNKILLNFEVGFTF